MTPIEKMVELFSARVEHFNADQLKSIQRTLTQEMSKGRWTFGSHRDDEAIAIFLRNKINSLERAKQGQKPAPPVEEPPRPRDKYKEQHERFEQLRAQGAGVPRNTSTEGSA